jgi:multiple sugar transport system permease protein/raffinose/stachyose/melibiose transport system permease protein
MTKGGPYHSSELLSTYMYAEAFQSLRLGYASALAVIIFLLAFGVIVTYLVRVFREDNQ